MLNLAIIGAGRMGQVHAKAVANDPNCTIGAIVDPFPESAEALAKLHDCRSMSIEEVAADTSIDSVIICSPTDTHADFIEIFARAGKAVFCEKPIDLSVERVEACLAVVKETGAKLMIGFNRRFDPAFAAAKAAIDDGSIGEVEQLVITSRDPSPPPENYIKVSGGIFRDMNIHDLDMARFLLGEEPATVFARGSVLTDPAIGALGDFDSTTIMLTTASGKQCLINGSRRSTYGYDQRADVHGSLGTVCVDNPPLISVRTGSESGYKSPPLQDFFMTRYVDSYAAEIAAFVDCVTNNREPSPSGEDGLKALRLAEAALKSATKNVMIEV